MVDYYMLQNATNYFCLTSKLFLFNEYTILIQRANCFYLTNKILIQRTNNFDSTIKTFLLIE